MLGIDVNTAITVVSTAVIFATLGALAGFRRGVAIETKFVIHSLFHEGFVKGYYKSNGELEIQKLNEEA